MRQKQKRLLLSPECAVCVSVEPWRRSGGTHDPAAPVRGHVAVHLDGLALVPQQVEGVQARRRVPVQQGLGAVLRVGVEHARWGHTHRDTRLDTVTQLHTHTFDTFIWNDQYYNTIASKY